MTANAAGDTSEPGVAGIADRIRRNAAQHGADLNDPLSLAGFLGAAAAVLAHASVLLPEEDQRAHAEAMLSLVDALAVEQPPFNTGWNALLAVHASMLNQSVKTDGVSAHSRDLMFDATARLLHDS